MPTPCIESGGGPGAYRLEGVAYMVVIESSVIC